MANWTTCSCFMAAATSGGVAPEGVTDPVEGTLPALPTVAPSTPDQAVRPIAATVRASLTTVFPRVPSWWSARSRLARSRPAPPTTWAPMATAWNGAQRPQPALATAARSFSSRTVPAAPLRPTAPIRVPPNQAAAPRSWRVRTSVLR